MKSSLTLPTVLVLFVSQHHLFADSIQTFDGKQLHGYITALTDGQLVLQTAGSENETPIPIEDANTISFDSARQLTGPDFRLVHPRLSSNPLAQTEGIPLRDGLHKLVIVYSGSTPTLSMAGENQEKKIVSKSRLVCPERGYEFTPSTGLDDAGYRLPDRTKKTRKGLTFRLYQSETPVDMRQINDSKYEFVKSGRFDQLLGDWPVAKTNLGIFTTMVRINADGRYRFWLDDNKDAWLYLGGIPDEIKAIIDEKTTQDLTKWNVTFVDGGSVSGNHVEWMDDTLILQTSNVAVPLKIPIDQVESIENQTASVIVKKNIDRKLDVDLVVATVDEDRTTAIEGMILSFNVNHLVIDYEGSERKIQTDKIVFIKTRGEKTRRKSMFQLARIGRNMMLPVTLKAIGEQGVSLVTTWGSELTIGEFGLNTLTLSVQNGRMQYLSDLEPEKVELVPYFDRVVGWQKNRALSGGPLSVGDKAYENGLAMHSKTRLTYNLGGVYERFIATVGIDPRMKRFGDVAISVQADGENVFSRDRLKGTDDPLEIDVQVGKAMRLTLVTDFGEGQDVGDQVNWADARLVKASSK